MVIFRHPASRLEIPKKQDPNIPEWDIGLIEEWDARAYTPAIFLTIASTSSPQQKHTSNQLPANLLASFILPYHSYLTSLLKTGLEYWNK